MQVPDNVVAAIKSAVGTGKILTASTLSKTPPLPPEQPKREPKVVQKKRDYHQAGEVVEGLDVGVAIPPIDRGGIKVENNVPIPKRSTPNKGKSRYPFGKMKVGESFFVKMKTDDDEVVRKAISAMSSAAFAWRKNNDKMALKFVTRRVEGGIRCWRST